MIITFDLGNSDLAFAAYENDVMIHAFRTRADRYKSVDEYACTIKDLLLSKNIDLSKIDGTIISSVVPSLTRVVITAIKRFLPEPILLAPGVKTGLVLKVGNPNEVGSDIVACCVGAIKKNQYPAIIVDLGTATKIIAINSKKEFIGCTIAPGVKTSVNTLVSIASQLPEISLTLPEKVIGTNTPDSMNSGVMNGYGCMVEGMINRIEEEINSKTTRILTGGLASTISKAMRIEHSVNKYLIFEGLLEIYKLNRYEK